MHPLVIQAYIRDLLRYNMRCQYCRNNGYLLYTRTTGEVILVDQFTGLHHTCLGYIKEHKTKTEIINNGVVTTKIKRAIKV